MQLNPALHENKRSSFCALGGSTRGGFNVKTDEPPRAGLTELAGRIWPAGRTLPTPGLNPLLNVSVVTVIEIGTETAVFQQNRTEPKPRFYASLLAVSKTELL